MPNSTACMASQWTGRVTSMSPKMERIVFGSSRSQHNKSLRSPAPGSRDSVETVVTPRQRPGCGRNYEPHNLREPSYSILCGEIKLLIDGFRGQGLPAIDFSHVDLSGSKQCPE